MPQKFKKSLFLLHKDFRLEDNTGLILACEQSESVFIAFIFDPHQANPQKNKFFNPRFFALLQQSLVQLDNVLQKNGGKLHFLQGETLEVVENFCQENDIEAFFSNADYTAFAKKRDAEIATLCQRKNISCFFADDACLQPPGKILKKDGTPYTVFTPFCRVAKSFSIPFPQKFSHLKQIKTPIAQYSSDFVFCFAENDENSSDFSHISREKGLKALQKICFDYAENRNFPWSEKNTSLSPFLRMGLISVREAFWAFFEKHGEESQGITELFWRDFFIHIGHFFPKIFAGKCFHSKYDFLQWENDPQKFEAWCEGKTGFPLVDAGMRELRETGFMHNRVRMVVASFLIKNLHIDWRWGEKFFAQNLIDYDVAVNNGNWQWSASTGCDSAPYFRIFSPTSQHERFDAESVYVKKWVKELENFSTKEMISIEKKPLLGYFSPICDSKKTAKMSKEKYKPNYKSK